jgi:hypothetical protein
MKARTSLFTGLLLAAGASAAILAAPGASADPTAPDCVTTGAGGGYQGGQTTQCQSPGNTQIDATPPAYAFPWEGDYWVL